VGGGCARALRAEDVRAARVWCLGLCLAHLLIRLVAGYVCVCVCVCARARARTYAACVLACEARGDRHAQGNWCYVALLRASTVYIYTHTHTYIHTYLCVCVFVCVCVRMYKHTHRACMASRRQTERHRDGDASETQSPRHTHTHATHTHTHLGIPQPIHAMFTAASPSSSIAAAPPSHPSSFAAPHPSSDPPTPSENNSDAPKVGDERVVTEAPGEGDAAMLACARSGKPWTALEDQLLFRCATAVEEGRAMGETEAGARAPSTDVRSPPPRSRAPARESVLSS